MPSNPAGRRVAAVFWLTVLLLLAGKKPVHNQTADADARAKDARQQQPIEPDKAIDQAWHPEEREHHRKERWYWRLSAILTAVAVGFTFITLVLGYRTYREAVKATQEAHSQALEAKRQADVAQEAYVETFHPVVDVSATNQPYPTTGPFHPAITLKIDNAGEKTFVTDFTEVAIIPGYRLFKDDKPGEYCISNSHLRVKNNQSFGIECTSTYIFDANDLSHLLFEGDVRYTDEIGTYYSKRFTFFYNSIEKVWQRSDFVKANAEVRFGPDGKPQKETE